MFEAVGAYSAGTMTEEDVEEFENNVCPTCGSCSGMYTANSMNCLTEAFRNGIKRKRNYSGCIFRAYQAGKTGGYAGNGNVPQKYPSERYYDKGRYFKCTDSRYGAGLLHQHYAAPARQSHDEAGVGS